MKGEAVRQDCAVIWCKGYQEHRCNGDPVETVSLRESIDQDSAMGRAMLHLAIVFAEMERDLARARTMAGLERVKATGKHLGRRKGVSRKRAEEIQNMRQRDSLSWGRIATITGFALQQHPPDLHLGHRRDSADRLRRRITGPSWRRWSWPSRTDWATMGIGYGLWVTRM